MNNSLETFIDAIPIHDLINKYIKLKKIARLYWGFCPFHSEKTPSFVVNIDKKFFYCFGCGSGGNAINFLMKIQNINFIEAVNEIKNTYKIQYNLPENLEKHYSHHQEYEKKIIEFFTNYIKICHQKLMINQEALKYLNQRGVSLDVVRNFNLGYDDGAINDLIDLGYTISEIQEYGILSNEEWTSKFTHRIILPITNPNNQYISVVGRALNSHKNIVKYLHAIENSIFYKKTTFFNYFNVENYQEIYIVEGFFDMLSCINNNIPNVVSCLGATVSDEQIFILQKKFHTINFLLDGDKAGIEGMIKAAYKFLPYYGNTRVNFLILPGMDPADYFLENTLGNLPIYNLEDFLWEFYIKPDDPIVDGTTITKIYKNIDGLLETKRKEEINPRILDLLQKYWQKKIYDISKLFYKNSNKKINVLPTVVHKSQLLVITLFNKIDEVLMNIDQLSKIVIQDKKIFHLFNKIINLVFNNENESKNNLQKIIQEDLNPEEIHILNNPQMQLIVQYDHRCLATILNNEYFV